MLQRFQKYKHIWLYILALMLISRACLYMAGLVGVNTFSIFTQKPVYNELRQSAGWHRETMVLPYHWQDVVWPSMVMDHKFDAGFYMQIATRGYDHFQMTEKHYPSNWVFFPLYPLCIALFRWLGFHQLGAVAAILSNLFLFGGLFFIYLLARQKGFLEGQAKKILFFVLIYPSSLYFSIPYTESLFLFLSAASLYFAGAKKYKTALLIAGLSTITRVPGFVNWLYVMAMLLMDRGIKETAKDVRNWLWALLSLVPLFAFLGYMKFLTGDFLAPFHEQRNWSRVPSLPFQSYFRYFFDPYYVAPGGWDNGFLSFVVTTAVLLLFVLYFWKRRQTLRQDPRELLFFVYGLLLLVIPFSSSTSYMTSVIRYEMVSLPLYFYLVHLAERRPMLGTAYQYLFLTLQVIITIAFFNNYFFVV